MYKLQFDGMFRKIDDRRGSGTKAGLMGYGWLIYKNGLLTARGHGVYAREVDAGSLIAEYLALIEGLESLLDLGVRHEPVTVFGDAKSIIDQMDGKSAVNAPSVRPLYQRTCKLTDKFSNISWEWTPRRENRDADWLTRLAMRQVKADRREFDQAVQSLKTSPYRKSQSKRLISLLDLRIYQPGPLWLEPAYVPAPIAIRVPRPILLRG